ncbi:hypothetical protein DXG03_001035 [Asterophora parasitica]|uniref:C2H2-type domain-containing protein n=1 Tax=Asterophora parasitica TaxID=117018 RepID=A0A9P7G752_9AGAR|nr:hypothetical protein DXG03_001035 [Asterophora parasitica]
MSSTFKRHRAPSHTSSSSSTSTGDLQHPSKASRTIPTTPSAASDSTESSSSGKQLLCTLPPTCNHRATPLGSTRDLETHYATYHAHVCEQGGCGAVFPDARLLELFACHLSTCPKLFLTPKTRRLHLIQAHGYPKEYFFAVTNKGVGGLLKRWGEGASMIRGAWKARETTKGGSDEEDNDEMEAESAEDNPSNHKLARLATRVDDDGDSNMDEALDGLADTMESLALVPPSIRFGRGGRKGGLLDSSGRGNHVDRGWRGSSRGGRGRGRGGDVDKSHPTSAPLGRAGRGRAGIVHVRGTRGGQ